MGLAERRVVQAVKDGDYKEFETNLKRTCGYDVKINFDWPALENNPEVGFICEHKNYNRLLFNYLNEVFTNLCADKMGKEAVKGQLKEIVLNPVVGDLTFEGGVLTINSDLNGGGAWDPGQIQRLMEEKL